MHRFIPIIILILTLSSCKNDAEEKFDEQSSVEKELTTAESIAAAHGVENWNDIEEIQFTFNVARGERQFNRSFTWKPKTGDVIYYSSSDTISYNRNEPMDSLAINADKGFINDSFWLLAPYKLVWDEGTEISEPSRVLAPISKDSLNMITLLYGSEGGYTPGDAYDFYYDESYIIKEWAYRGGNAPEAMIVSKWDSIKNFNGLKLATFHRYPEPDRSLYFTNILVK